MTRPSAPAQGWFFVTTPCHHPVAAPGLEQAYPLVLADTLARFARLGGRRSYLLAGTDEYGAVMQDEAASQGLAPRDLAARNSARFSAFWRTLDIDIANFVRTTEPRHIHAVQDVVARLHRQGDIWLRSDAAAGRKTLGSAPRQSYTFRLSRYQQRVADHIRAHPRFIRPTRVRAQVLRMLRKPLPEPVVSRTKDRLAWGIETPFATDLVTFVWLDGLISYLAPCYTTGEAGEGPAWPPDLQIIGARLTLTHAIYWPAILMALGLDLPRSIFFYGEQGSEEKRGVNPQDSVGTPDTDVLRGLLCLRAGGRRQFRMRIDEDRGAEVRHLLGTIDRLAALVGPAGCRANAPALAGPARAADEHRILHDFRRLVERLDGRLDACRPDMIIEDCGCAVAALERHLRTRARHAGKLPDTAGGASRFAVVRECLDTVLNIVEPIVPQRARHIRETRGLPTASGWQGQTKRFWTPIDLEEALLHK